VDPKWTHGVSLGNIHAMRRLLLLFVLLPWVGFAGCGGSDSHTSSQQPSPARTTATAATASLWAGTWRTTFGTMRLTAGHGDTVTGTYAYCGGTLTGTVTNAEFTGTWSEDPSASDCQKRGASADTTGGFTFTLSDDGTSFAGTWTYANGDKNPGGDAWRGRRG
jgi:hypothetical protein